LLVEVETLKVKNLFENHSAYSCITNLLDRFYYPKTLNPDMRKIILLKISIEFSCLSLELIREFI